MQKDKVNTRNNNIQQDKDKKRDLNYFKSTKKNTSNNNIQPDNKIDLDEFDFTKENAINNNSETDKDNKMDLDNFDFSKENTINNNIEPDKDKWIDLVDDSDTTKENTSYNNIQPDKDNKMDQDDIDLTKENTINDNIESEKVLMEEPAKPFACTLPECGMSFTNEDHLHVHTKKHDMVLQLGLEQKAAFVADQTPTPTRFIRNCEEVGLFQDLQNVNPFDEGFKRAMETKQGILSLESALAGSGDGGAGADDVLHTPQMVFPLIEHPETTLYSATNNQRNITISRSSSDETGTVKEYETTTISKLTNEVTTISRIVGNRDVIDKIVNVDEVNNARSTDTTTSTTKESNSNTNVINEKVYKNNVIKIHSNVEIRKDGVLNINNSKNAPVVIYTDSVIKDSIKDVLLTDNTKLQVADKVPPIMSQKSLDFVVDSLTTDLNVNKTINTVKINTKLDKVTKTKVFVEEAHKVSPENDIIDITDDIIDITDDSDINNEKTETNKPKNESKGTENEYEVIIKLPSGKKVKMKPVEDTPKTDTKEVIRKRLTNKKKQKVDDLLQNVLQIPAGTLIPVTLVNSIGVGVPLTHKLPLPADPNKTSVPISQPIIIRNGSNSINVLPVMSSANHTIKLPRPNKRVLDEKQSKNNKTNKDETQIPNTAKRKETPIDKHTEIEKCNNNKSNVTKNDYIFNIDDDDDYCITNQKFDNNIEENKSKRSSIDLERRSAASKRYRERLRDTMRRQAEKNRQLEAENAALKLMITEHIKCCSNAMDLSIRLEKLRKSHYAVDSKNKK